MALIGQSTKLCQEELDDISLVHTRVAFYGVAPYEVALCEVALYEVALCECLVKVLSPSVRFIKVEISSIKHYPLFIDSPHN
ncbi:hypothetical protein PSACC_02330 [Paramicrosporidium saccamoebae]|uniref:Uncharacterized protein n=1 Tax=Paramicrosporidium saccamoebae TaxID=1246581 RepID=A0A2H9TJE9_9FUNG|nr:hypothetical protein PSACC_02330 [Paramicrosporidium saccamoebae]